MSEKNNHIFGIKMTHTAYLKQVIERIESAISETCIVFIPPDNDEEYQSEKTPSILS